MRRTLLLWGCVGAVAVATGCSTPDTGSTDTGTVVEAPDAAAAGADAATTADAATADSGSADTGAVADAGSGDSGSIADAGTIVLTLPGTSRSAAIAITTDDRIVIAVNPDSDSASIFSTATKLKAGSVAFPAGSMPVSLALHPDNKTAYVVLRKTHKLAKVSDLDKVTPTVNATFADVGAEPTGVALAPNGTLAVVANYGQNTVSIVDLATGTSTAVVVGRNPRAVTITNNGDAVDTDEKAYVTLFYGEATGVEGTDTSRTGKVIEVSLSTRTKTDTIDLAPITVTGIQDSTGGQTCTVASQATDCTTGPKTCNATTLKCNGNDTGCSPNQLFAITQAGNKLYVPNVCASPKGPVFKFTNLFSVISVIDLATKKEDRGVTGTVVLNKLVVDQQGTATGSLLGIPADIDFKGSAVAYVLSQAAEKVQRVFFDASTQSVKLGTVSGFAQIDLGVTNGTGARGPLGIVVARTEAKAYVNNWISRNISVIDLNGVQRETDLIDSAALPTPGTPEAAALNGKKFFYTGTGRWSDRGVSSCASCHPDGTTDNITWIFAAGPRQTTDLSGSYSHKAGTLNEQRAFNWTGILDEMHDFENNTRGTSGGKGAIVDATDTPIDLTAIQNNGNPNDTTSQTRNDNLSGTTREVVRFKSSRKDWDDIEKFGYSVRANAAPLNLDPVKVAAGRTLFTSNNCSSCHGGDKWTVSRVPYTPAQATTGNRANPTDAAPVNSGYRTQALTIPSSHATVNKETKKVSTENIGGGGATCTVVTQATDCTTGSKTCDATTLKCKDAAVGPERINCVIRDVGTFDKTTGFEKKADGSQAQGQNGFNPPSLLGLATGAPYLHNGAAKTLRNLFSGKYARHHQAFAANFLIGGGSTGFDPQEQIDVDNLVEFLLSIDETTAPVAIPAGQDICGTY